MIDTAVPLDGRVARRARNVNVVLDVVLEMFSEESLFPSIEQAASRSGLSLRSVYRYFADPGELLEAAIKRSRELGSLVGRIHTIGEGNLGSRVDALIASRLDVYDVVGPMYRATLVNAAKLPRIRDELATTRHEFRDQFELQFATELDALRGSERVAVVAAGDVLTQLDSIDFLRRHRQLSVAETAGVVRIALTALFTGPRQKTSQ